jgi:hypothetical protein
MHRKELNERSPLRLLEQSIHGGLGRGNIGVVVARPGVGKTAFLVGVALDDLMRGRKVLHVALDEPVDKIRDYYDEIFMDLARSSGLEDLGNERLEIERNRNIHTYIGNSFSITKLRDAIAFLRTHMDFDPEALIIEGYSFERATTDSLAELREIARDIRGELWMSAVTHRNSPTNDRGVPEPVARVEQAIDVILSMKHSGSSVHLHLLKDHDNPEVSDSHVALDPTTLLLIQEQS